MGFLPKSRSARRRLTYVAMIAPVLVGAAVLAFVALGDSVSLFYTPSQAKAEGVPVGKVIQLGGCVLNGSVVKHADGTVEFAVGTEVTAKVRYKGDLPDLFREGQGVVAKGAFARDGAFDATQVLAKHDEKYMPRELEKALKDSGEWRGEGSQQSYGGQGCTAPPRTAAA